MNDDAVLVNEKADVAEGLCTAFLDAAEEYDVDEKEEDVVMDEFEANHSKL